MFPDGRPVARRTTRSARASRVAARWIGPLGAALLSACATLPPPGVPAPVPSTAFTETVLLHGKPLELHLSRPRPPAASDVMVLYASGDGGWFGAAVDMFRRIADAGYNVVGFSSRAFLRIERPPGALVGADQLAVEYDGIVARARTALGLGPSSRVVLSGWSRGAAFAVLAGSEAPVRNEILGVVAIGLTEGEDLAADGAGDESDDGPGSGRPRQWPFDTYARIARLAPLPCAVIQATRDNYLPAGRARELFGPDGPERRFYRVDARNHRFSGGKAAFHAALVDALRWVVGASPGRRP